MEKEKEKGNRKEKGRRGRRGRPKRSRGQLEDQRKCDRNLASLCPPSHPDASKNIEIQIIYIFL